MSARWLLTKSAKTALTEIYIYTHKTWGKIQADNYVDDLYKTFDAIANRSALWRPIEDKHGVIGFHYRYKKHRVYWGVLPSGQIGIAAILHEAMLQSDRLKAAFGELPAN